MNDGNIIKFKPKREPLKISFSEIDIANVDLLNTLTPEIVQKHYLLFAKHCYEARYLAKQQTWLDRLVVFVGIPAWILSEAQLDQEQPSYTRVPLGLLIDLFNATDISLPIAVTYKSDENNNLLIHTEVERFVNASKQKAKMLELLYTQFAVSTRSKFIVEILQEKNELDDKLVVALASLAFCEAVASGNNNVFEWLWGSAEYDLATIANFYKSCEINQVYQLADEFLQADSNFNGPQDFMATVELLVEADPNAVCYDKRMQYANGLLARSLDSVMVRVEEDEVNGD
jgi:hypothetical protein